ncbi:hypothetical protein DY000_02024386 [Brassica cretica]|uniref:Uncharacterized protein n=1 Tax=Brassica cretica TaxID=69181 RepID=A0ABQ7E9L1_BRACR|nr:hypothetical protein DY000_02024386 [Brassica cretica]
MDGFSLFFVWFIERDVDEDDELGGWDKDFLDAAFKAKEILLSTQVPPPAPPIVPPPVPASESVELIR